MSHSTALPLTVIGIVLIFFSSYHDTGIKSLFIIIHNCVNDWENPSHGEILTFSTVYGYENCRFHVYLFIMSLNHMVEGVK